MNENNMLFKGDRFLWGVYFLLCIISIVEIYSSSSFLTRRGGDFLAPAMRQIAFVLVGIVLVVVLHNCRYKWWKLLMLVLLPLSFLLMLWTDIRGVSANGANRWMAVMGTSLQPSEFAKLATVLTLSYILSKFRSKETGEVTSTAFKGSLIVVGIFGILIFIEDFSTAVLLVLVSFCMMMVAGVQTKKLLMLVAILVIAVAVLVPVSVGVYKYEQAEGKAFPVLGNISRLSTAGGRIVRFGEGFGKPLYEEKIDEKNYQSQHAYMAIAHGGVIGVFPGNSRERDFLPQAYSDFIYAIIVEETGMIGGIFVMALYLSILLRAGVIARRCEKSYPAFLIIGLAMMIAFQALINMGVSVSLFPVTGQTLPLVSRGGTSFFITSIYFGIMLSVSRFAIPAEEPEKEEGEPVELVEEVEGSAEESSVPDAMEM